MGVTAFFVISGFVLPLSLSSNGYRLSDAPVFLLKRAVRLEPPYLATILLIVTLGYVSTLVPLFRGATPHFNPAN